jgi:hypothetical protein
MRGNAGLGSKQPNVRMLRDARRPERELERMNVDLLSKLLERAFKTAPDGRREDAQVWELRKPKALAPLLVLSTAGSVTLFPAPLVSEETTRCRTA